jgi:hypothetical protein
LDLIEMPTFVSPLAWMIGSAPVPADEMVNSFRLEATESKIRISSPWSFINVMPVSASPVASRTT